MDIREKLVELLGSLTTVQVFCDMDGDPVSRLVSRVVAEEDVDGLADHLIANGVTVQEWRPVSEPPKECGRYYVHRKPKNWFSLREIIEFDGEQWRDYSDEEGFIVMDDVTHWMPLPQPPKGE